jgi:hypothetical protein
MWQFLALESKFVAVFVVSLRNGIPALGCPGHRRKTELRIDQLHQYIKKTCEKFDISIDRGRIFFTPYMLNKLLHIDIRFLHVNGMCYWK